jgi:branched-chain amino acid transport system substrate-binding protein
MKIVIPLLTLAMMTISSAVYAVEKEPIKIGALYNLTGSMSAIDKPAFKGAKLAEKLINNKGGILNGRKIEIIGIDTKTDLKVTVQAAKKLVSEPVLTGIGYGDTDFVLAAAPLFQKAGIPFITSGATDPSLPTEVGLELFMVPYGDNEQAAAMAHYSFKKLKARNVAVLTNRSAHFTRILSKFFKQSFLALGGKIVADLEFGKNHKEIGALVDRIKKLSPPADAIYVAAVPPDVAPTVKPLRNAGIKVPIMSGDGFDSDLSKVLGSSKLTDNIYFTTHAYRGSTRPEVIAFVEAYKKAYGEKPNDAFAALGFDAINLIVTALESAKTTDRKALTKALSQTKGFKAVTGEITYTQQNRVPIKPIAIISFNNGKYQLVQTWTLPTAK